MNLVSVLIAPAIVGLTLGDGASAPIRYSIAGVALLIIVVAVAVSKRRSISFGDDDASVDLRSPDDEPVALDTAEPTTRA